MIPDPPWYSLTLASSLVLLVSLLLSIGINWAIYQICYFPRSIGPFTQLPESAKPRTWKDVVPIWGWIRLRRESDIHGKGYWIRPLFIQIVFPILMMYVYQFEVRGRTLPPNTRYFVDGTFELVHLQFFLHSILLALMTVATFIDFDEFTIPDWITVPGTLIALILHSISDKMQLTALEYLPTGVSTVQTNAWTPDPVNMAWFNQWAMWVGLFCFAGWCFGLADRRLRLRRGVVVGIKIFFRRLFHNSSWKLLAGIWGIGSLAIVAAFQYLPVDNCISLYSALLGIGVAGGLVWLIRIIASLAMGTEALGFGDVTLMAMIGAFLGWQAGLLSFFLAPLTAIVIVIIRFIITRRNETPFGPYICAGALVVLLFWQPLFVQWFSPRLLVLRAMLMWMVPAMLILLGVSLFVIQLIKSQWRNRLNQIAEKKR